MYKTKTILWNVFLLEIVKDVYSHVCSMTVSYAKQLPKIYSLQRKCAVNIYWCVSIDLDICLNQNDI